MTVSNLASDQEIIDFGGHFHTNLVPARPDRYDRMDEHVGPAFSDPEAYIEVQQQAGITGNVVVAPLYVQGDYTIEQIAEANDVLLDIADSFDHFIGALASIPFDYAGDGAAAEFERCLDNGFSGGVIDTINNDNIELIDAAVEPVFEVAARTNAPVMVHPRAQSSLHPDHDVLTDRYRNNAVFGREVTLMDSLTKVIHEGVFDRYPDLQLVYDHTGGNIASMLGRLEYQLDKRRLADDPDTFKDWTEFRPQLEEHIYLKMSGYYGRPAPLRTALEEFPASHVLFGTDFPMEVRTAAEMAELIDPVEEYLSLSDAHKVFSENARNILVNVD